MQQTAQYPGAQQPPGHPYCPEREVLFKFTEQSSAETTPVFAVFNDGRNVLVVDDGCWVVGCMVDDNIAVAVNHLFQGAVEVLRSLPSSPNDYGPYKAWKEAA